MGAYYGLCFGDRCNRCIRMDNWTNNISNNYGWICIISNSSIYTKSTLQT